MRGVLSWHFEYLNMDTSQGSNTTPGTPSFRQVSQLFLLTPVQSDERHNQKQERKENNQQDEHG
jgi:hypothetical protein